MKWPAHVVIIRHGQSIYNGLRNRKEADPEYAEFKREFERDHRSKKTMLLALLIRARYALSCSDYGTPLSKEGRRQAHDVGSKILSVAPPPDIIFASPYRRTHDTLFDMMEGGFETGNAQIVLDDRIREQEHGLSLLYNDWRVFQTFHPEQRGLHELLGPYWYQYPQGESVSQVRDRVRSFIGMLVRECSGKVVYLISHHLTKLSIRANLERMTPEQFIILDEHEKPINCGVTIYKGNPNAGKNGKLELVSYNERIY